MSSLLHSIHSSHLSGHLGRFCTRAIVERNFWWPGLSVFVNNFIAGCAICQQNKACTHPVLPPLSPIKSSSMLPFKQLSVDLITDLPLSHRYDSLMVMVDHDLTKGVILAPCSKTVDTNGIAQLFFDHVFKRFGLHDTLISDRAHSSPQPLLESLLEFSNTMSASPPLIIPKPMDRPNELIRKLKLISRSFVQTTLTSGLSSSPPPNSNTTLFPTVRQRSLPSLSSLDTILAHTLLLVKHSSLPLKAAFLPWTQQEKKL